MNQVKPHQIAEKGDQETLISKRYQYESVDFLDRRFLKNKTQQEQYRNGEQRLVKKGMIRRKDGDQPSFDINCGYRPNRRGANGHKIPAKFLNGRQPPVLAQ